MSARGETLGKSEKNPSSPEGAALEENENETKVPAKPGAPASPRALKKYSQQHHFRQAVAGHVFLIGSLGHWVIGLIRHELKTIDRRTHSEQNHEQQNHLRQAVKD
jgi:hypothetical protein